MNLTDWIGATGVFLILLAYVANLKGKLTQESLGFILLNIVGGSLACTASVLINYVPFMILEGAWTLVSLGLLVRYFRNNTPYNPRSFLFL